jgi:hypothetical protein
MLEIIKFREHQNSEQTSKYYAQPESKSLIFTYSEWMGCNKWAQRNSEMNKKRNLNRKRNILPIT